MRRIALDLAAGSSRQAPRIAILGALNWAKTWYRPSGDPPAALARRFLGRP